MKVAAIALVAGAALGVTAVATAATLTVTSSSLTTFSKTGITVDPVSVTSVVLRNKAGQTPGQPGVNDEVVVDFAVTLKATTVCSAFSDTETKTQKIDGDNQLTVTVQDIPGGNDVLSITSTACTLNIGQIDLGSGGYATSGNLIFAGSGGSKSTLTFANRNQITVVLGGRTGTPAPAVTRSVVTYAPSSALRTSDNRPLTGTFRTGDFQHF